MERSFLIHSTILILILNTSLLCMKTLTQDPISNTLNSKLWEVLLTYPTHNNYLSARDQIKALVTAGADINQPIRTGASSKISQDPNSMPYDENRNTPVNWAIRGENYDVYELLLENGAEIPIDHYIVKTPRIYYISVKHLLRRVIVPHRKPIRTLLLCMNRIPGTGECVRQAHTLLRKHLLISVAAECAKALEPYQWLRPYYNMRYKRDSFDSCTIQRFLDLFL